MKVPQSLHVLVLEFLRYNQRKKFWKRSFDVKFNFACFSLKKNVLSSEEFHFVNNWFSFSVGNYNDRHNIFDTLPDFLLTTSETKRDC